MLKLLTLAKQKATRATRETVVVCKYNNNNNTKNCWIYKLLTPPVN